MKLTLETTERGPYARKITYETPGDDQNMEDMADILRAVLASWGYAEQTINTFLGQE